MPKPLVDLDKAARDCTNEVAKLAGVRHGARGLPMRATIQAVIREAMRKALPPADPRKITHPPTTTQGNEDVRQRQGDDARGEAGSDDQGT